MKVFKEHTLFILLLLLCVVLRMLPLFEYQFTYDELSGLERTKFNNFNDLIHLGIKIDAHPALVQLIIFAIVKLFGYHTWLLKLPFLLTGFAAVVYAYLFGLRNFSKGSGLIASIFLSFSLIFVYYAPIARMYMPGIFFSIALLYYFFEIFFLKNAIKRNYLLFGLFALLSAYNHHINALFACTVYLSGALFLNKTNVKVWMVTGLFVVLVYLPHMPLTLYQFGLGGIGREQGGWLEKPDWNVLFDFIKIILGTGKSYLFISLLIIIAVMLNKKFFFSKQQLYLLFIFLLNYLVVLIYSQLRAPIYQHSVMLFSGICFILIIAPMLTAENKPAFYSIFTLLLAVLIYKSYFKKDYFGQAVKTVFEYQFEKTLAYKKKYGDKNVFPVFFDADVFMKKIFFDKYQSKFDCLSSEDSILTKMSYFSKFISELNTDYLVLTSAYPGQQAVVKQYYPYLLENTQTQAINFKLYSRLKADRVKVVADDEVLVYSSPYKPGSFSYNMANQLVFKEPYPISEAHEFPFEASAAYSSVVGDEGQVVLSKIVVKPLNADKGALQLCVAVTDNSDAINYGYSAKAYSDFVQGKDSSLSIYTDHFIGTNHQKIKHKSAVSCYLWNREKESYLLSVFEISVVNFWVQKWHYWD